MLKKAVDCSGRLHLALLVKITHCDTCSRWTAVVNIVGAFSILQNTTGKTATKACQFSYQFMHLLSVGWHQSLNVPSQSFKLCEQQRPPGAKPSAEVSPGLGLVLVPESGMGLPESNLVLE